MSKYSLRAAWRDAPWRPKDPDPSPPEVLVEDAARRMAPLSEGLLASSYSSRGGKWALPFSLRTILDSFVWPDSVRGGPHTARILFDTDAEPTGIDGGWAGELQGFTADPDLNNVFLTTTEGLWAVPLPGSKRPVATSLDRDLSDLDAACEMRGARRDAISLIDEDGYRFVGRKCAFDIGESGHLGLVVHLSAPCFYRGRLLVPGEGDRGPPGTPVPFIGTPAQRQGYSPDFRYQKLYVFDPSNLGYLGMVCLPAADPPEGLGDNFTSCCVDERSGILWTTRDGANPTVNEVFGYQLPDLELLATTGSQLSLLEGVPGVLEYYYPKLYAAPAFKLELCDIDGRRLNLADVGGSAFSPQGHLFVNYQVAHGDKDKGVLGFDVLTGRGVRYISLAGLGHRVQGMAYLENELKVLIWKKPGFRVVGFYGIGAAL